MGRADARLDWLTLRSDVEPRSGMRWCGSFAGGRFVARDAAPPLEVFPSRDKGGAYSVSLVGAGFFRRGELWREFVRDVWGWPPPPLSASRVDVAVEQPTGGREARLEAARDWLLRRCAERHPMRYGWAWDYQFNPTTGTTFYVFPQNRERTRNHNMARADCAQLWRVYQERDLEGGFRNLRIELERKRLTDGDEGPRVIGADEAVLLVGHEFERVTDIGLDDESAQTGAVECAGVDARQSPAKLLRQAYGLVRLAELRGHGGEHAVPVRLHFGELWRLLVGGEFDGLTYGERRESERRERAERRFSEAKDRMKKGTLC